MVIFFFLSDNNFCKSYKKIKDSLCIHLFTAIHLLWLIQAIIEMHDKHFLNLHDSLNIACW